MTRMRKIAAAGLAGVVATLALAAVAPAAAGGAGEVRRSGSCTGASTWKLKLKKDDGRIETEFEVDQNKVGKRWKVVLKHNGVRYFKGIRTTVAPSGSFEVERRVDDVAGTD
ncbi:MAG TPA: hypothetical protein VK915_13335, partial [Gaiellaceae bacterium]|nr:hypothetical protein [Gaiellaceae bacterium]